MRKLLKPNSLVVFSVCKTTEPSACDQQCRGCEGMTHHWGSPLSDCSVWKCIHCNHEVLLGDTSNHPSGCDCPDCMPDDFDEIEEHPCDGGHSFTLNLFGVGVVCEVCGLETKYERDDTGRYCHQCCGYVCFCSEENLDEEDFDNMSL